MAVDSTSGWLDMISASSFELRFRGGRVEFCWELVVKLEYSLSYL
jgi:hypothetical protein